MASLRLGFLLLMLSIKCLAQNDKDGLLILSFMYDHRVGDSYSFGIVERSDDISLLNSSGFFLEGSYGGFFGKKSHKDIFASSAKEVFNAFSNRYGQNVSTEVDVKQRNWHIAFGLMPGSADYFYYGLGITSVRLNQFVHAFSKNDKFAQSINTSFDGIAGFKFESGSICFDLRVGYSLFMSTRQTAGNTSYIRDYFNMSSEEYSWFKSVWDSTIEENAVKFLPDGFFVGFSVGFDIN